jgi:hypothetical protein
MLFKGNTALGSYVTNSVSGIRDAAIDLQKENAQSLFDKGKVAGGTAGEIHDVGQVYAAIWYGVWKEFKDLNKEMEIETLFMEHLTALHGTDTYPTTYNVIKVTAGQIFPAAEADAIRASFRDKYAKMGFVVN